MIAARLFMLTLAGLAAGCAAAAPGYEPLTKVNQRRLVADEKAASATEGPTGSMPGSRAYALSDAEKGWDCKRLTGVVQVGILREREASTRPAPGAAVEAGRAIGSIITKTPKDHAGQDPGRERARIIALNHHLAAKGCRNFDVEAEIAKGPGAPVPQVRAAEAKKK